MSRNTFTVIDVKTGQYPDLEYIALHEEWAKGLIYCDMEGFAVEEDGSLLLLDECDNSRYCPIGRFEIVWDESVPPIEGDQVIQGFRFLCGKCHWKLYRNNNYCSHCGKKVK